MKETSPNASPAADIGPVAIATAERRLRDAAVFAGIFLLFWSIYLASGSYQRNPFNAHVHLAYSLLHGRFDLVDPPGYFETVKIAGRSYIAYGIAPSLLMVPFVAIFGLDFHQAVFMAALAALAVAIWNSTLGRIEIDQPARILLTILFGLGSLFWFYSGGGGNTWSLMHVTAVFGLTLALYDTLGDGRGWLAGVGFGIAVLSRQPVLLSLPFFVVALWRKEPDSRSRNLTRELLFVVFFGTLVMFDAFYNWERFGSIFDNGYKRVILATTAPRFHEWGIFSFNYMRENSINYFLRLPENLQEFPWYDPTMAGFSMFISTPALWLAFSADYRKRVNLMALAACLSIQALYLTYFWSGYEQFGCRYTIDYLPFVNLLAANGSRKRSTHALIAITAVGALIEVWGMEWWRYKGW